MTNQWVTVIAYAEHAGKSPQYIRKIIKAGKLTQKSLKKVGKKYFINPIDADIDIQNNTNKSYVDKVQDKPKKKPVKKKTLKKKSLKEKKKTELKIKTDSKKSKSKKRRTLAEAQEEIARHKADLKKIELDVKKGKYVLKTEVNKDSFLIARTIRDSLLNIPDRISAELASINDRYIISEKLMVEITTSLEDLTS